MAWAVASSAAAPLPRGPRWSRTTSAWQPPGAVRGREPLWQTPAVVGQRNAAVLLAGGIGTRVGLQLPKQLVKVGGKPIMEYSLAALDGHPAVDDIVIMMASGHVEAARAIVDNGGYTKVRLILEGGESRSHTTLKALDAVESLGIEGDPKVLTHDAVRPFVSARIIGDCFTALDTYDAVDVAIPLRDTIIEVGPDNTVPSALPRATVRSGQTPQAFRMSALRRAYAHAMADPDFEPADDCTVMHRYLPDVPIWVVAGEERNMKVTQPIDIFLADKLLQMASRDAVIAGHDEDAYRAAFDGTSLVVLGGGPGAGTDIAELATSYGARVKSFARSTTGTHVERRADVRAALEATLQAHGGVDFVVNTAGVVPRGTVLEASDETLYSVVDINYLAPLLIAQEFFPALRDSGGSLLLFSSASYTRGRGGLGLQSSANAAVVNLTQALADEWAADEVRINCVINPEGAEGADSLRIARASLDTLLSSRSGQIIDFPDLDTLAVG